MEKLKARLYEGMAERGITGDVADEIFTKMAAFANYGFPESHSVSFSYLVYASSWIKFHEPAAFCAALLNAQPMGFWSPHSLAQDARRHGVVVRSPDLNASLATATLGAVRRSPSAMSPCDWGSARCAVSAASSPRRSKRGQAVRVAGGSGAPGAVVAIATTRGNGNGGHVRGMLRARTTRGVVGGRRCGAIAVRIGLEGIITGRAVTAPARHGPDGDASSPICGPPASRPTAIPPSSCASELRRQRCRHRDGLVGLRAEEQGAGGRARHPSPATDDGARGHVHEPRGRNRADQHRRVEGVLGPLPQRSPAARRRC